MTITKENAKPNTLYIDSHEGAAGKNLKEYVEKQTNNKCLFKIGDKGTLIENVEITTLEHGDYIYNNLIVERKTVHDDGRGDFRTSIETGRFRDQLMSMRYDSGFKYPALILMGDLNSLNQVNLTHIWPLWKWSFQVAINVLPCVAGDYTNFCEYMGRLLCDYSEISVNAYSKQDISIYPLPGTATILGAVFPSKKLCKRIVSELGILYPYQFQSITKDDLMKINGVGEAKAKKFMLWWHGSKKHIERR